MTLYSLVLLYVTWIQKGKLYLGIMHNSISLIDCRFDQEYFDNNSRTDETEISVMETSVEMLPASEPRGRLAPLPTSSPSKTEGVKKLFGKTFHQKRGTKDEPTTQPVTRRTRAKAVSISEVKL